MEGKYYLTIRESLLMGALVVDCRVSSGAVEGSREGINGLTDKIRFEPITTLGSPSQSGPEDNASRRVVKMMSKH
jgi:hypothetical protein